MANTTPFILTSRAALYPHDQIVASYPVKVVSARYDGAALAAYKGSAVATSDVARLITIPAGALVLTVTHVVKTAEGGTCTYGIGDGDSTSGYVAAANGNSTSTNASSFNADATTPDLGNGKYYAAADTIDVILTSGTAAAVVIDISVVYIETKPLAA